MTSIGFSRVVPGMAAAGVIALAAGGVIAPPAHLAVAAPASVTAPVALTALSDGSSLMDQFGDLTGLSGLLHILDDPNGPLFPFTIAAEGLGELFVIMPLLLLVGVPLVLITGGPDAVQQVLSEVTAVGAGVTAAFDGIKDWYATHNAFTGALLDPPHDAAALSLADPASAAGLSLADPAAWTDALHGDLFGAGGVDAVPVDLDLGGLGL